MSHYLGSLADLRATMASAHSALSELNNLTGRMSFMRGSVNTMHGLGDYDAMGNYYPGSDSSDDTSIDFGQPSATVVSQTTSPVTGNTATTYSDGSVSVTNAAGQDVTSSFVGTQQTNMGNPITNAISDLGDSASNLASKVSTSLPTIGVIAVVGLVAYVLLKDK
jgi:hypothetical protein